jgi:hypothetical protein
MNDMNGRRDPGNLPPRPIRWQKMGARGATWRMPVPLDAPPELTRAQREELARAEARGEARAARLHLPGLLSGGVIIVGLVLAVVIVMFMLVLLAHH